MVTSLFVSLVGSTGVDNLIKSQIESTKLSDGHLNNSEARGFWLDCDYHSIEANYFEQANSTFALSAGSNISYKCSLVIDTANCSIYHTAVTKLIPLNCRDVQIVIQLPASIHSIAGIIANHVHLTRPVSRRHVADGSGECIPSAVLARTRQVRGLAQHL